MSSMISSARYKILNRIKTREQVQLYSAMEMDTDRSVILKYWALPSLNRRDEDQFRAEFHAFGQIVSKGVIQSSDFEFNAHAKEKGVFLVYESFPGILFEPFLRMFKPNPLNFLQIAINIVSAIKDVHKTGLIYQGVRPETLRIEPDSYAIKILDSGYYSLLNNSKKFFNKVPLERLCRSILPYFSPEQTGRMEIPMDHRTDFYSLGILFYELLFGAPPFKATNAMELIHAHMALIPSFPDSSTTRIPQVLIRIIKKLLAKSPEDRYQSAFGLKHDLEYCLTQWRQKRAIAEFPLAQKDASEKFNLPRRMYGREKEIDLLTKAFNKACQGESVFVFVKGEAGIGKTRFINVLKPTVTLQGGIFLSGKYDVLQSGTPYSAIIDALRKFVLGLLTENKVIISKWRKKLQETLGDNARVLVDVIPEIGTIMGHLPTIPALTGAEAQSRFHTVVERFMNLVAQEDHPLVLFLDDLQWGDAASLSLIDTIVSEFTLPYFLLIGAYREQEGNAQHLLMHGIASAMDTRIVEIKLPPISITSIAHYIRDILFVNEESIGELSRIVFAKTRGNPFFVGRFLQSLYTDRLIWYDFEKGAWQWDLEKVCDANMTDNVVALLCEQIGQSSPLTPWILKLAACIGDTFTLAVLVKLANQSEEQTLRDLEPAITENMIRRLETPIDPIEKNVSKEGRASQRTLFEFQHSKVRHTIYALLTEKQKRELHYQIGKIILAECERTDLKEYIFAIVNHLNIGIQGITDQEHILELVRLNLVAGKKAKTSSAFQAAAAYLQQGRDLLDERKWNTGDDLTRDLFMESAECEYLCGRFEMAEALFVEILSHVQNNLEKAAVYRLKVVLDTTAGHPKSAVKAGMQGLSLLGVKNAFRFGRVGMLYYFIHVFLRMHGKSAEDFTHLPKLKNPVTLEIIAILSQMAAPAFYVNPILFSMIALYAMVLVFKKGTPGFFPFGVISYGLILSAQFKRHRYAYQICRMGVQLFDHFEDKQYTAKAYFTYAYFILHWVKPVRDNLRYLRLAQKHALENGDISFVGHSINTLALHRVIAGDPLDAIFDEYQAAAPLIRKTKDPFIINDFRDNNQFYRCLKGQTPTLGELQADDYDPEQRMAFLRENGNVFALFMHLLMQMKIHCLFGRYPEGHTIACMLYPILKIPQGTLYVPEFLFFDALILSALYLENEDRTQRRHYIKRLKRYRKLMEKWSRECADNFEHKYLLISAEIDQLQGNAKRAIAVYQKAQKAAERSGYSQNLALIDERTALFFRRLGFEEMADQYILKAYYGYRKWGANAKSEQLIKTNKALFAHNRHFKFAEETQQLDFMSIVNSLQIISTEIVMANLLQKLIRTVKENAGATRVVFISLKGHRLLLEAETRAESDEIIFHKGAPINSGKELLFPVIQYVVQNQQHMVVHDARKEREFADDPYVLKTDLRSVICMPVVRQQALTAILYLENTVASGVFTRDRVEILKLLASQAAISFENAKYYQDVALSEQKLRKLSQKREELEEALRYRLEKEMLIAAISSIFMSVSAHDIKKGMDQALSMLGRFVNEDRSYVFQISPDRKSVSETNEWCADGIKPHMDHFQHLSIESYPWIHAKLSQKEIVLIHHLAELPEEAKNEHELLSRRGVLSFMVIPMVYRGDLVGFMGFEAVRKEKIWNPEDIKLLQTLSEILANACVRMQAELNQLDYQTQLRSLSAELSLIEEKERRKIAIDLHDRIGHTLAFTKMKLSSVQKQAPTEEFTAEIEDIKSLIDQTIKDTHSLTFELSPPVLYDLGLESAIEWLAEQTQEQHGIRIDVRDDMAEKPLSVSMRVLLFRSVRELLFNMVKHAQATQAIITIQKEGRRIVVQLKDDGVGFDLEDRLLNNRSNEVGGFGLFSIRERIHHQGGNFVIDTAPQKGTHITIKVPLEEQETHQNGVDA